MEEYLDVFKALSDKTRLRMLSLLIRKRVELCLCEVADALDKNHYNVSRHFKVLKRAGLVKERREGRYVFYSLAEPESVFYEYIIKAVLSIKKGLLKEDNRRLKLRISLRKNGRCVVGLNSNEWKEALRLHINRS